MIAAANDCTARCILLIGLHPVWHVLDGAALSWPLRIAMTPRRVQAIAGAEEQENSLRLRTVASRDRSEVDPTELSGAQVQDDRSRLAGARRSRASAVQACRIRLQ
jgi:hypothetical protein